MTFPLNGHGPSDRTTTKAGPRTRELRRSDEVAGSRYRWKSEACQEIRRGSRGAGCAIRPIPTEFMATGSYLSFDTWDSAEPSQGKSVEWLKSTSRRLKIWLGASFFEASGADFYDTFVLTAPSGADLHRRTLQRLREERARMRRRRVEAQQRG